MSLMTMALVLGQHLLPVQTGFSEVIVMSNMARNVPFYSVMLKERFDLWKIM